MWHALGQPSHRTIVHAPDGERHMMHASAPDASDECEDEGEGGGGGAARARAGSGADAARGRGRGCGVAGVEARGEGRRTAGDFSRPMMEDGRFPMVGKRRLAAQRGGVPSGFSTTDGAVRWGGLHGHQ